MKSKRIRNSSTSSSSSASTAEMPPPEFAVAVTRIAVVQICQSVGFRTAQSSALETLTDVAVRYLQSVAKYAGTSAVSTGRTQSNLLDIFRALEELHSVTGFTGNSNPRRGLRLLSDSSVLCDIMKFVNRICEIPFAKTLSRQAKPPPPCSFNDVGRPPNRSHIPGWLPAIPEMGHGRGDNHVVSDSSEAGIALQMMATREISVSELPEKREKMMATREISVSELPEKREKVRFRIGFRNEIEMGFRVDLRSGICKRGKRISWQIHGDDENLKFVSTKTGSR